MQRLATALIVLAAAALPACSHALYSNSPQSRTESADMTTHAPANHPQPKLDAEAVLLKVLDLIRTSDSVADITPARLTEVTGLPVGFDGKRYGVGGALTKEWGYGLEVNPGNDDPVFLFSFEPIYPQHTASAIDICALDFDHFSSELGSMGFKKEVRYGEHGMTVSHLFNKGALTVEVGVEGTGTKAPPEVWSRQCVRRLSVR